MSSAYFVRSSDKQTNIYGMEELPQAIVDFMERLADGEAEHVELVFSA